MQQRRKATERRGRRGMRSKSCRQMSAAEPKRRRGAQGDRGWRTLRARDVVEGPDGAAGRNERASCNDVF